MSEIVITTDLELDLDDTGYKFVKVHQYDNYTRNINITLVHEHIPYSINTIGNIAYFRMARPNGTYVFREATITSSGKIDVLLTQSDLSIGGVGKAEIDLYQKLEGGNQTATHIATMPFDVVIISSVYGNSVIESSDDFSALDRLIEEVGDYKQVINTTKGYRDEALAFKNSSQEYSVTSKSWAIGGTGTRTGENTDNSKYYSSESQKSSVESSGYATSSAGYASNSEQSAQNSSANATTSKSWAVGGTGTRDSENVTNSKYYYEKTYEIATSIQGLLLPQGTITFEQLIAIDKSTIKPGYTYNVSNSFTSDSTFKDGGNHKYSAGTNVYLTVDNMWDCLASPTVTGIKGSAESEYHRNGDVSISYSDVGADQAGSANSVKEYFDGIIGETDISQIGDGTVTGAISKLDYEIWSGTQAEVEAAIASGEIIEGTLVHITDDEDRIIKEFELLVNQAEAYADDALASASSADGSMVAAISAKGDAETYSKTAKSYAIGGTSSRTGEDTDNAKYYYEQSSSIHSSIESMRDEVDADASDVSSSKATVESLASQVSDCTTTATQSANSALEQATSAKSYAVGYTGTREGEDTDNAKYYYEQTRAIAKPVLGVKGDQEDEYRTGNVNLTSENIGAIDSVNDSEVSAIVDFKNGIKINGISITYDSETETFTFA